MTAKPARALDGVLLALSALAFYTVFAQMRIYGDGFQFVMWVNSGHSTHAVHFLFLPFLHLVDGLLGDTFGFYQAARFMCALGTALGVWLVHGACRHLGLDRWRAVSLTWIVALTPSMVFFATVLEIHGVFFAFVGLAFWVAARLVRTPGIGWAIALGAATAASYLIHASGAAMIMPLGLWVFVERLRRGDAFERAAVPVAIASIVHLALIRDAYRVVPALLGIKGETAVGFWAGHIWFPLSQVALPTLWYEWIAAYAPLSVLFVAGFFRSAQRGHAFALAVTLLPYWAAAIWLIPAGWNSSPPGNERGAYLTPLVLPAAWIVVHALPRGAVAFAAGLAIAISIATVRHYEDCEPTERFVAGIVEHTGDRPVTLFTSSAEGMQACTSYLPDHRMIWIGDLMLYTPDALPHLFDLLERTLADARDQDRAVVLPQRGITTLEQCEALGYPAARPMLDWLRAHCEWIPIVAAGFEGFELRAKGG